MDILFKPKNRNTNTNTNITHIERYNVAHAGVAHIVIAL